MTTIEQMYQKAQQYADEVEDAIMNDQFTFLVQSDYTCSIEIDGVKMSIWMGNGPESTHIYQIILGDTDDTCYPKHQFANPGEVRNILLGHYTYAMQDTQEEHY